MKAVTELEKMYEEHLEDDQLAKEAFKELICRIGYWVVKGVQVERGVDGTPRAEVLKNLQQENPHYTARVVNIVIDRLIDLNALVQADSDLIIADPELFFSVQDRGGKDKAQILAELRKLAEELMAQQDKLRELYWNIRHELDATQDKLCDVVSRIQLLSDQFEEPTE